MRRLMSSSGVLLLASWAGGQAPPPMPPQKLPVSVTGQPAPASAVRPTAAAVPQQAANAPIMRFAQNLANFPPETVQSVYSLRAGADWLWRMNQPNGRFFYGLNPSVRRALDGDHDLRQALAAYALCESARFTGDERLTARATQTVLALLAQVKQEPVTVPEKANRSGLLAGLVLAVYALPEADAKLLAETEALCGQLRSRFDNSGVFRIVEDGVKPEVETASLVPGLALHALAVSNSRQPEPWKVELITQCAGRYRTALRSQPNALVAATLLPGIVELALASKNDPALCALAFELADSVCECQYGRSATPPVGWFGGFKLTPASNAEPNAESVAILNGLIAAMKLTRQVPDVNRYVKYRVAVVDGLSFCRTLQYTDETTDHFEKSFRSRFLLGGAHLSPSDGTVRIDATAQVVLASLNFLSSGAESRE